MKKQFLSILLAFCMIVALLPITAMAADDELVITGNAGGYTYSGGVVKIQSGGEYTITMKDGVTETTDHIEVASDEAVTIILNGVKINANPRDTAMKLTGAGTVTLKLASENMLQSDNRSAGIQQDNTTAELIITSCSGDGSTDGKLEAIAKDRGAGIGGGYSASAGKITINGGTITAISQGRGAGIGGGGGDLEAPAGGGSGGNVTINGGMVTANGGGYRGAGIGGGGCQLQNGGNGGSLTVNGGTVFALGNDVGGGYISCGIGGGYGEPDGGTGTDIVIRGGTVTATGHIGGGLSERSHTRNGTGTLNILPQSGSQIEVWVGEDENTAAKINGSPFTATTDLTASGTGQKYFHSVSTVIPVWLIDTDKNSLDFGSGLCGDAVPDAQTITIRNKGNQNLTLNQPTASNYVLGTLSKTTLVPGETGTLTVQPKEGLLANTYAETLNITANGGAQVDIPLTFTVKAEHLFGEWTSNGDGTHTRHCKNSTCTAFETKNCTGGTATCISKAVCEVCGKEYGTADAKRHARAAVWTQTADTHQQKYDCCGIVVVTTEKHQWQNGICQKCGYVCKHSGGTATCKEKAVCAICGIGYGEVDTDHHTGNIQWIKTATTHEQKYKCCGAAVVAKEDHQWKNGVCKTCNYACKHSGGTATCKEKAVCAICGIRYGEPDWKNHSNLKRSKAQAATITKEGNIEYWYCDGCNKYYSDKNAAKEIRKADTVIAKLKSDPNDQKKTTDKNAMTDTTNTAQGQESTQISNSNPKTGDNSSITLWLALLLISSGTAVGVTVYEKKKKGRVL